MADYNSRYTGSEIEAAIARTDKIGEFAEIWAGSPTTSPISLNSLPVNPGTGDRTGLYFVSYESSGATNYTSNSMMHIFDESKGSVGTGHSDMATGTDNNVWASTTHVVYEGGNLKALADSLNMTTGTLVLENKPVEISRIYRFQKAV
jgi:hypothetical protein